ncbi:MAG: class I SAM-dependent methyltransferase [Planctomycetia bacterium]
MSAASLPPGAPWAPGELEQVPCPGCGAAAQAPLLEAGDALGAVPGTWRLVACAACGLAYLPERPTLAALGRCYPAGYEPHEPARDEAGGARPRLLARALLRTDLGYPPAPSPLTRLLAAWARRRLSARQRQRWLPCVPGGRLLDVGCGAGRYLVQMRGLGWQVEGLDASQAAAAALTARTGIAVHVGTLPPASPAAQALLGTARFDAVTLWASLEHVHQPREALEAARTLLRPGGTLALSVPNLASWSARAFGTGWYGLDLPRHLVHFTPATLCALAARAGFAAAEVAQVGRAGWIRRSVARARQLGVLAPGLAALEGRRASERKAAATERAGEADSLVLRARA